MAYPQTLELLTPFDPNSCTDLEAEMQELTDAINALPAIIKQDNIDVHFGNLEIKDNQLTIWDKNGNIVVVYDLFDYNGNPTTTAAVYKREVH